MQFAAHKLKYDGRFLPAASLFVLSSASLVFMKL
uniref:Uncharacterized protein n=1 Tax=Arundo donax TaxID=35708 RepID=A0A0A9EB23_ARUDO